MSDIDKLMHLHRSGIITASDFTRFASELTKTDSERLAEAEAGGAARSSSSSSELLVGEDGYALSSLGTAGSEKCEGDSAGSFDHEPDYEDGSASCNRDVPDSAGVRTPPPVQGPMPSTRNTSAQARPFKTGDVVLHPVYGTCIFQRLGNACDFVNNRKARVTHQHLKPGCSKKRITTAVWVEPSDLTLKEAAIEEPGGNRTSPRQHVSRAERPSEGEGQISGGPQLAVHERGRVLPQKPKRIDRLHGRCRGTAHEHKTKETNVPIQKRIEAYPNQSLKEVNGKLFCQCCPKLLQNIAGTIRVHVNSDEHKAKYLKWIDRCGADEEIKRFLHEYYENNPDEAYASVSSEDKLYRYRVVEAMLHAGIPISKVDDLRALLERCNNSLTGHEHLKVFIPKIETREHEKLMSELKGQLVTIIFDGTTRLGEALVILARWIPADFSRVEQRLTALRTTFKHTTGDELSKLIMQVLLTTLKIDPSDVVGGARDSCSTNAVAMRAIKALLTNLEDFMCISHTLSHTGEHVELSTLDSFMTPWLSLVQNHPAARTLWKNTIGTAMVGYSTIRWCSREEVQNEIATNYGALGDYLQTLVDRDIGEAHPRKMLRIYNENRETLENELALSLDLKVIISAVYTLEGDGLLILLARSKVDALLSFSDTVGDDQSSLPNLAAVLRKNTELKKNTKIHEWYAQPYNTWYDGQVKDVQRGGRIVVKYTDGSENVLEPHEAQAAIDVRPLAEWKRLVQQVKNGIGYLHNRMTGNCEANYDCTQLFEVYRLVQAFDPSFAVGKVDYMWVDGLSVIPALAQHVPGLKRELPAYLAACQGITFNHEDVDEFTKSVLAFWASNGKKFPTWALGMQIVGSFTPSSAAAERVFSLLKLMFGDLQDKSLADLLQAALMLRYNKRSVG